MDAITFTLTGRAMSQVEGSELTQRPHLYDGGSPDSLRAGEALNGASSRKVGRFGRMYTVTCDRAAAEVIREYFQTQGEIFLSGTTDPEGRADGRVYLEAASRIKQAMS